METAWYEADPSDSQDNQSSLRRYTLHSHRAHNFVLPVPEAQLPQFISAVEQAIEMLTRNDPKELAKMGLTKKAVPYDEEREEIRLSNLDNAHWKCALAKRYSGNRIAEAIPNCRYIIEHQTSTGVDALPHIFLAVAIMKSANGDLQEAKREMEIGLPYAREGTPNELWGRAHYSRLLRKLGMSEEAKTEEDTLRSWYKWHPYAMPPSAFAGLMNDVGETTNHIVEGIPDFGKGIVELGPGMMVSFN